jgi:hypothetical protein
MKKQILILTFLLIGYVSNAQLGSYYANVLNNHSRTIIQSDNEVIITKNFDNDIETTTIYYFTKIGLCDAVVILYENFTYDQYVEALKKFKYVVKEPEINKYSFINVADDGVEREAYIDLFETDEGELYIKLYVDL